MDTLWQDLKFGFRLLARSRAFFLTAVTALALGIGANTAVFSVVYSVLLKPLPYPAPDRLVMVHETMPGMAIVPDSFAEYAAWRDQSRVFSALGASTVGSAVLTGHGDPQRLQTARMTAPLFRVFAVRPFLGRWFSEDEDRPNGSKAVVLSYALWKRLGSDTVIVGKTLTLDDVPRTVVGVMPDGFTLRAASAFLPLGMVTPPAQHEPHHLSIIGRLKDGVTVEQARSDVRAIAGRLAKDRGRAAHDTRVVAYHDAVVGNKGRPLLVLLATVAFVLLIACANVANLLLARATTRRREIAVRSAIGASRMRLARQMLTESLIVSLTGGVLGLALAWAGVRAFVKLAPPVLPRMTAIAIDLPVLLFTLAVALATGCVFGLAPVLHARRDNAAQALADESGRTAGGRGTRRAGSALVVAEIAASVVLLIGAGLMLKSLMRLQAQDLGLNPERLLTFTMSLPASRYQTADRRLAFYADVLERIRSVPGVTAAGTIDAVPLSGTMSNGTFDIEGRPPFKEDSAPIAEERLIDGDYLKAMGVRLVRGRPFTDQDSKASKLVVLVNESMAKRFWPNEDPIGQRIQYGSGWAEIVGITSDARILQPSEKAPFEILIPYRQQPAAGTSFVVRSGVEPTSLIAAVRRAVAAVDPTQPLAHLKTMNAVVGETLAQPKMMSALVSVFAGLAALLALVGVYGLVSYAVAQQTREFGIRMAMGANGRAVLRLVLGRGVRLAAAGVVIGAAAAFGLTRWLTSMLYEVQPTDPIVFTITCAAVLLAAITACLVPARAATRVDPMVSLRG